MLWGGIIFCATCLTEPQNIRKNTAHVYIDTTASYSGMLLMNAAKKQIGKVTTYDFSNGYYSNWWYPPDNTGVCSDVIWRAFKEMGYDFKKEIMRHHKNFPNFYSNFWDDNINFRRVKNIDTFLRHTTTPLSVTMIPYNTGSLSDWQPWDIVVFDALPPKNLWHIGIIADTRRDDGVPYMIDNHWEGVSISITPLDWPTKIIGHYRYF